MRQKQQRHRRLAYARQLSPWRWTLGVGNGDFSHPLEYDSRVDWRAMYYWHITHDGDEKVCPPKEVDPMDTQMGPRIGIIIDLLFRRQCGVWECPRVFNDYESHISWHLLMTAWYVRWIYKIGRSRAMQLHRSSALRLWLRRNKIGAVSGYEFDKSSNEVKPLTTGILWYRGHTTLYHWETHNLPTLTALLVKSASVEVLWPGGHFVRWSIEDGSSADRLGYFAKTFWTTIL